MREAPLEWWPQKMKPAFHTSVQKEREKQAFEEMGFTFCTAGWERERDREGSGGFVGVRKKLGEILERQTVVRLLTHKWNLSDLHSQKLTHAHFTATTMSNNIGNAQFKQTCSNIDPERKKWSWGLGSNKFLYTVCVWVHFCCTGTLSCWK